MRGYPCAKNPEGKNEGTALRVVIVPLAFGSGLSLNPTKPLLCQIVVGKDQAARKHRRRPTGALSKATASSRSASRPTRGQADSRVKFISRGRGYRLFLTCRRKPCLSLQKPPAKAPLNTGISPANRPVRSREIHRYFEDEARGSESRAATDRLG